MSVFVSYQVHSQAKMSKAARTTNAMEIGFTVFGEVKVYDDIHRLNINAPGKKICNAR
jgi:hypothetical protein